MSKKKTKEETIEMLIVKSKIKEYVKTLGDYNVSSEFYDTLNLEVAKLVKKASKRATRNSRKTVSSRDV
ncbi:MAG: hypothetical protein KGD64_10565 [Candidatus Heimdallarchaeota archaeon]|nr:hypothetical protein [Candidatus Heimdallarchaeota archaeon]